jgi:tetratricopeptide (TPR) repeat protein
MYNLILSFAAGVLVALLVRLAGFPIWAGIIPGTLVFVGVYVVLARRIALKVQALVNAAQKELSSQPTSMRDRDQKVAKSVKLLEEGLAFDKWQFLIASELHAQIGMIKYMVKDFDGAQPHLAKANPRNGIALGMLASLHYQKKDYPKSEQTFEAAVRASKKEGVLYAVYAWCLMQQKKKDEALKVLARGVAANPSDEKLKAALTAVQNDKKLKMKAWEPLWWQFGLENPPLQQPMGGGRRVQFERR